MALNVMIRRATSTVVPLAIRAARSSRSFHGVIPTVVSAEKANLRLKNNHGGFYSLLRFSTVAAADEDLIHVLHSAIQSAENEEQLDLNVEEMPDGFPFEIRDNPGKRTVSLKRQFKDETVHVEVNMLVPVEGDENEDNEVPEGKSRVPLVVNLSRGNGPGLEFAVSAYPDDIVIDSLSIKRSELSDDQFAYEGPDFDALDENLQKTFQKFLEIRGVKPSVTNYLIEYMVNKDCREYLQWLKDLQSFIKK